MSRENVIKRLVNQTILNCQEFVRTKSFKPERTIEALYLRGDSEFELGRLSLLVSCSYSGMEVSTKFFSKDEVEKIVTELETNLPTIIRFMLKSMEENSVLTTDEVNLFINYDLKSHKLEECKQVNKTTFLRAYTYADTD